MTETANMIPVTSPDEIARLRAKVNLLFALYSQSDHDQNALRAELQRRDGELNEMRAELQRRDGELSDMRAELQRGDDALAQVFNSRSWRLIAPMRALERLLK